MELGLIPTVRLARCVGMALTKHPRPLPRGPPVPAGLDESRCCARRQRSATSARYWRNPPTRTASGTAAGSPGSCRPVATSATNWPGSSGSHAGPCRRRRRARGFRNPAERRLVGLGSRVWAQQVDVRGLTAPSSPWPVLPARRRIRRGASTTHTAAPADSLAENPPSSPAARARSCPENPTYCPGPRHHEH